MSLGAARASASYLRLVTLAVLVPSWMALIDGTVVSVGLDTIAGNLGVSVDEGSWIASIYVLAGIFVMPLTGWMATNAGRKRSFLAALVVFTAASVLCAFSTTLPQLVVARFLQGVGGGLILPLAMAALVDAYPSDRLASAFKFYGVAVMVGPVVGPVLGGWILANMTWPWIFLINIPLGIVSFFLASSFLPEQSERGERSAFDWGSLAIMIAGFAALQFVVQEGPRRGWFVSPQVTFAAILAALALFVFVRIQVTAKVAFVDLRPLATPSYAVAMLIAFLSGIGFAGCILIAPLYAQEVLRYAPDVTGMMMVPAAFGTIIGTEFSGRVQRWISPVVLTGLSLALAAAGTVLFAYLGDRAGFDHVLMPRFLQGLGVGLLYVPLNVLMMSEIPKKLVDAASGFAALTRQISFSIGFAILTSLVVHNRIAATTLTSARFHRVSPADPGFGALQRWFAAHGYSLTDASSLSLGVLQELVARAATSVAYSETFIVTAALFIVSIPALLLFLVLPRKETTPA